MANPTYFAGRYDFIVKKGETWERELQWLDEDRDVVRLSGGYVLCEVKEYPEAAANLLRFIPNKLSNASFETDENSDGLADDWTFDTAGADEGLGDIIETLLLRSPMQHGERAQKLRLNTAGGTADTSTVSLSQADVPVEEGVTYHFCCYVYIDVLGGINTVTLTIDWVDEDGAVISTSTSSAHSETLDTWEDLTVSAAAPEGAVTADLSVAIARSTSASFTMFVDNAQFMEGSARDTDGVGTSTIVAGSDSHVVLRIESADTEDLGFEQGVYDLFFVDKNGKKWALLEGLFLVAARVTELT